MRLAGGYHRVLLEGNGHFPHREAPGIVADAIVNHLQEKGSREDGSVRSWSYGVVCNGRGAGGRVGKGSRQAEEACGDRRSHLCSSCSYAERRCRAFCALYCWYSVCRGGFAEAECGRGVVVEGPAGGVWSRRSGVDGGLPAAWRYGRGGLRSVGRGGW